MANRIAVESVTNPFAFEPGESSLVMFNPLAKLAFLIAATSSAMHASLGFLVALFATGILLLSKLPRATAGPFFSVIILILFAALVKGIFPGNGRLFDLATLPGSAVYGLRLLSIYVYSRLFYATTRVSEIGDWMTAGLRSLRKIALRKDAKDDTFPKFDPASPPYRPGSLDIFLDPGMFISLILLFLPRIFNMYRRVAEAAEVRGLSISKKNFRRALLMLEQLISMSLLQSWKISLAMELRSYSPYRSIKLSKFKKLDWILVGISAILFLF